MRIVLTVIAAFFILGGAILTSGFAYIFLTSRHPVALLALLSSFASFLVGLVCLAAMPYRVSCSAAGLEFAFILRREQISWDQVEWYRPLTFSASVGEHAGVWTLIKYRVATARENKIRFALPCLEARGPGFGSLAEFRTEFDQYVPAKNTRRPRAGSAIE